MTRKHVLSEIQRTATANGGVPLGQERFATETGIRKTDWYGKYWVRWSDALREAGLQPNRFTAAVPEDELLAKLAALTRELGHFPVEAELRLKARADATFPSHTTFRRLGDKKARADRLRTYSREKGFDDVAALCVSVSRSSVDVAHAGDPDSTEEFGFVYLMKAGRFYKVGRTNAVGRRERELAVQLPERAQVVHSIKTDDPCGIEAYWHRRFQERRKNGEWFELSARDVAAFRRRRFM